MWVIKCVKDSLVAQAEPYHGKERSFNIYGNVTAGCDYVAQLG